jgi:hypothetical protein
LCENGTIYYDSYEYENAPVAYNSGRGKHAYQYAAFMLWEGINHRRPHYTYVENGVRALFLPLDGKIIRYKSDCGVEFKTKNKCGNEVLRFPRYEKN